MVDPEYMKWAQERAAKAREFFLVRIEDECARMFGSVPPRVMDAARALVGKDSPEPEGAVEA